MKRRILSLILVLVLFSGIAVNAYTGFTDVDESDWFYDSVTIAYLQGIMNGVGDGQFKPYDTLTVAEAIKISACVHANYYIKEKITPNADSTHWADGYYNYAVEAGIIKQEDFTKADFDKPITRDRVFYIFSNTLPESEYPIINEVELAPEQPTTDYLTKLFCAGIVIGNGKGFECEKNITRAECAEIVLRMTDHSERRLISEPKQLKEGPHNIYNKLIYVSDDCMYYYDFASGKSYLMEENVVEEHFPLGTNAYLTEDHQWLFYVQNGSDETGSLICRSPQNPDEKPLVIDENVETFTYYEDCGKMIYLKRGTAYNASKYAYPIGNEIPDYVRFDKELYEYDAKTGEITFVSVVNDNYQYLENGKYIYVDIDENLYEKEVGKAAKIIDNRVKDYKLNPDNTIFYRKDIDKHIYLSEFVDFDTEKNIDEQIVYELKNKKYSWFVGEIYSYDGTESVLLNSFGNIEKFGAFWPSIYSVSTPDYSKKIKYSEIDSEEAYQVLNEVDNFIEDNQKTSFYAVIDKKSYEIPAADYLKYVADDLSVVTSYSYDEEETYYYKTTFENGEFSELVPIAEEEVYRISDRSSNMTDYYIETDENDEDVLMAKVNGEEIVVDKGYFTDAFRFYNGDLIYFKSGSAYISGEAYICKDGKSQRLKLFPYFWYYHMVSNTEFIGEYHEFISNDYTLYNVAWLGHGNLYAIINGNTELIAENVDGILE